MDAGFHVLQMRTKRAAKVSGSPLSASVSIFFEIGFLCGWAFALLLCVCVCVCHRHMSLSHTYTQPLQITHGRWDGSTATDRLTMDAQLPHTTHTQTHTHAGTHTHTQREREREMQHGPSVDPRVIHPSIQRSIKVLKPYARGHAMYAAALQAMRQAGRQRTREPMIIQASIT
mmetsp:Transcript_23546/g.67619  ORF Transcript_23546/g.67619 Transcript_23546/m.67619 type:complete len:173 (+) Transcript_23546:461-979(+)